MSQARLDSACEKLSSTLEQFTNELEEVRADWERSKGARGEDIQNRRTQVIKMVTEAQRKVEGVRANFDYKVDRGA